MSQTLTDDDFIAAFENGRIPGENFHHADHLRMAFRYLCTFPALEAIDRFSKALVHFAAAHGKPNLYHETITWAFLLLIRERIARLNTETGHYPDWDEFAIANPDLLNWKENILKQYYRDETLVSELARKTFVLPDRM